MPVPATEATGFDAVPVNLNIALRTDEWLHRPEVEKGRVTTAAILSSLTALLCACTLDVLLTNSDGRQMAGGQGRRLAKKLMQEYAASFAGYFDYTACPRFEAML